MHKPHWTLPTVDPWPYWLLSVHKASSKKAKLALQIYAEAASTIRIAPTFVNRIRAGCRLSARVLIHMFAGKLLLFSRCTHTYLDVFQLGIRDLPAGRAPGLLSPFTQCWQCGGLNSAHMISFQVPILLFRQGVNISPLVGISAIRKPSGIADTSQ